MLQHADRKAANNVDEQNQNSGDSVTANKFGSAIHRAIKVRLTRNFRAAAACFGFVDQPRVEVSVNCHLFAWHRIEREARRNFSDAPGTLGNHNEIDHYQNRKHHQAYREIPAHKKVAKCFDHLACSIRPGVALQQHDPRRSHIE